MGKENISGLVHVVRKFPSLGNIDKNNITEWLNCDANDMWYEHLTNEDIINRVIGRQLKIKKMVKRKSL